MAIKRINYIRLTYISVYIYIFLNSQSKIKNLFIPIYHAVSNGLASTLAIDTYIHPRYTELHIKIHPSRNRHNTYYTITFRLLHP